MMSSEIDQLAAALIAAQSEFSAIPKGSLNPFFKSKYAALPEVVATAGPVLAKHGLGVSQLITEDDTLTTLLLHVSGQWIGGTAKMHLVKNDPQAAGSSVTYMRRYAYMSILGLVADEDDDGNKGTPLQVRASHAQGPVRSPQNATQELTVLQTKIRADESYSSMSSAAKAHLLEEVLGHPITSIRDLVDSDCLKVLTRLGATA